MMTWCELRVRQGTRWVSSSRRAGVIGPKAARSLPGVSSARRRCLITRIKTGTEARTQFPCQRSSEIQQRYTASSQVQCAYFPLVSVQMYTCFSFFLFKWPVVMLIPTAVRAACVRMMLSNRLARREMTGRADGGRSEEQRAVCGPHICVHWQLFQQTSRWCCLLSWAVWQAVGSIRRSAGMEKIQELVRSDPHVGYRSRCALTRTICNL